jgi:hypothetical protein
VDGTGQEDLILWGVNACGIVWSFHSRNFEGAFLFLVGGRSSRSQCNNCVYFRVETRRSRPYQNRESGGFYMGGSAIILEGCRDEKTRKEDKEDNVKPANTTNTVTSLQDGRRVSCPKSARCLPQIPTKRVDINRQLLFRNNKKRNVDSKRKSLW